MPCMLFTYSLLHIRIEISELVKILNINVKVHLLINNIYLKKCKSDLYCSR